MPLLTKIYCPQCHAPLTRKAGGRCPHCATDVREHVAQEREREIRVDQIVAVVSTILVVAVSLLVGGCSLAEGILAYAVAGAVMWLVAKKTFFQSPQ